MADSKKSPSLEARFKKLRTTLQNSIADLIEQAKNAELHLTEIKEKISKIDRAEAKARFIRIKTTGLSEINRLKGVLQQELGRVSKEVKKSTDKLKTESTKVRTKAKSTLHTVKHQIKTIAETERNKRRGRSRSE